MSYSSHWLDCFQLKISARFVQRRKLNDPQPVAKNQEQQDGLYLWCCCGKRELLYGACRLPNDVVSLLGGGGYRCVYLLALLPKKYRHVVQYATNMSYRNENNWSSTNTHICPRCQTGMRSTCVCCVYVSSFGRRVGAFWQLSYYTAVTLELVL